MYQDNSCWKNSRSWNDRRKSQWNTWLDFRRKKISVKTYYGPEICFSLRARKKFETHDRYHWDFFSKDIWQLKNIFYWKNHTGYYKIHTLIFHLTWIHSKRNCCTIHNISNQDLRGRINWNSDNQMFFNPGSRIKDAYGQDNKWSDIHVSVYHLIQKRRTNRFANILLSANNCIVSQTMIFQNFIH